MGRELWGIDGVRPGQDQCTSSVSFPTDLEGNVTEFAPKSQFCGGKSTFDERLAVRRVAPVPEADGQGVAEHEEAHLGQDQCTRRVSFPTNLEGNVTTFAPHKALKLTLWGKLTFDETLAVHRVAGLPESDGEGMMRLVSVRTSGLREFRPAQIWRVT